MRRLLDVPERGNGVDVPTGGVSWNDDGGWALFRFELIWTDALARSSDVVRLGAVWERLGAATEPHSTRRRLVEALEACTGAREASAAPTR